MARYRVTVADNFHYMERDEWYEQGAYDTAEEALAVCRGIVDTFLAGHYQPGLSAEALYQQYTDFGEDPFIEVLDGSSGSVKFSAWSYAKGRCGVICGDTATGR